MVVDLIITTLLPFYDLYRFTLRELFFTKHVKGCFLFSQNIFKKYPPRIAKIGLLDEFRKNDLNF